MLITSYGNHTVDTIQIGNINAYYYPWLGILGAKGCPGKSHFFTTAIVTTIETRFLFYVLFSTIPRRSSINNCGCCGSINGPYVDVSAAASGTTQLPSYRPCKVGTHCRNPWRECWQLLVHLGPRNQGLLIPLHRTVSYRGERKFYQVTQAVGLRGGTGEGARMRIQPGNKGSMGTYVNQSPPDQKVTITENTW